MIPVTRRPHILTDVAVTLGASLLSLVLLATPSRGHAATLTNGMNASDLLGQYDDSLTNPQPVYTKGPNYTANQNQPNSLGLNHATAVAVDTIHHRLFVADLNNNRVLIYTLNIDNTVNSHIPSYVLGQADFHSNVASATQAGMNHPYGLAYDGTNNRLFVSGNGTNRVLVFNVSTISNGMNASYVLGQPTFTATGSALTQAGLSAPTELAYDNGTNHLFVADTGNNRVLVFTGSTLVNGMNAAYVLGQTNFTSAVAATTQSGMKSVYGLAYDSGTNHLFVADYTNNRVLVFSGATLSNGMNANTVLGQANFTSAAAATTQAGMNTPIGVAFDTVGNRLFVASAGNNRVLVFSGSSLTTGMNAVKVLDQPNFTTGTAKTTQSGASLPEAIAFDNVGNHLYVAEFNNNRVTVFNTTSITNGMNASDALGQYDDSLSNPQPVYTKGAVDNIPNSLNMGHPERNALDLVHHRLFVDDADNNRILIFSLTDKNGINSHIPSYVIGQPNFYTNAASTTQSGLNTPDGLAYDPVSDRLFASDESHRVLVYNLSSISNGMNASYVLGQTSFSGSTHAVTQSAFYYPFSLSYDTTHSRLFVDDSSNNRVLIFDLSSGITNGMNASYVLGQADFTHAATATTQSGMNNPVGLAYDDINDRLYVGEFLNYRVVAYNLAGGITNGMNANYVLGQTDFTSAVSATSQSGMSSPYGLAYDSAGNRLFVADAYNNNRVLIFNTAGLFNGMSATSVLGQPDFTTSTANTTQAGFDRTSGISYDPVGYHLFVNDYHGYRVMIFDLSDPPPAASSSSSSAPAPSQPTGGHRGLIFVPPPSPFLPQITSSRPSLTSASSAPSGTASSAQSSASNISSSSARSATPTMQASLSVILRPSNLRMMPSASATLLATLRKNWQVTIESVIGPWAKVRTTGGKEGYVLTANVTASVPLPSPASSSSATSSLPAPAPSGTRITTLPLKVHADASMQSQTITQLPQDQAVPLLDVTGAWAKIRLPDGREGFVVRKYLRK